MSYWVNVDFPTSSYRLHRVDCRYCTPSETPFKGVKKLKRDGGWLEFSSKVEARNHWKINHANLKWDPCKVC